MSTGPDKKIQRNAIRLDLQAAKSKTLYKKPTYLGVDAAIHQYYEKMTANEETVKSSPVSITKAEFKELVVGKTMAEIRSTLGKPSNVDESADAVTWLYWTSQLQVRDTEAGTIVGSSAISFNPAIKVAIGVHF